MTFRAARGTGRAGALIDDGTRVLDLQATHRARYGQASPRLASVLAIVEGGDDAVDLVHALVAAKRRPKPVVLKRESIKLGAPIPRPPQMRDFLCFENVARSETLHPGEFFGSGTVGNGCGLEQLRFLTPGDVVELKVDCIGVLRNRVVKP